MARDGSWEDKRREENLWGMYELDNCFKEMWMGESFEFRWKDSRPVCILDWLQHESKSYLHSNPIQLDFQWPWVAQNSIFQLSFCIKWWTSGNRLKKTKAFQITLLVVCCQMVTTSRVLQGKQFIPVHDSQILHLEMFWIIFSYSI